MKNVAFDLETDGFLPDLTKIYSLVLKDLDTGEVVSCADQPGYTRVIDGLVTLSKADRIYGHNVIRFDVPAILKLHPHFSHGDVFDTLVMVRLRYAHVREMDFARIKRGSRFPKNLIGNQGLEAWGHRLGMHKGSYAKTNGDDAWEEWSPEMQRYCEQDVEVTARLVDQLRRDGIPTEALNLEMKLAWYLAAQEENGWPIDMEAACQLQGTLAGRRQELTDTLVEHFGSWFVPGAEFTPKRDNRKLGYVAGVPCTKIKRVTFNPGSRQHIANRLQKLHGWQPTDWTPTGEPKVDETVLESLGDIPMRAELSEYLLVNKRLGQLSEGKEAWLKHSVPNDITGMHHVHHSIGPTAITHRHRHSHPNMSQVPASDKPYGNECRALYTVPDGWVLLGADKDGLELRGLAHYMARYDGGAFIETVLSGNKADGTDFHSLTAQFTGLVRSEAKRFNYAYLYGAGNAKLGLIAGASGEKEQKRLGKKLRGEIESGFSALGKLQEAIKTKVRRHGYLKLPDGRRVYVRSEHAALNSLLQGAGAVICKRWIVNLNDLLTFEAGPQGWDGQWAALCWSHDEVQLAVTDRAASRVKKLVEMAAECVEHDFKWRLPLTATGQLGGTWADTH